MNLDGHFLTFQEAEDACATIGVLEGLIKNKIIVILTCLLFLSGVWHAAQEWTISDARSQIKEFEQVDLITVEYVNIMDEYNQKLFNLFQFQREKARIPQKCEVSQVYYVGRFMMFVAGILSFVFGFLIMTNNEDSLFLVIIGGIMMIHCF